MEKNFNDIAKTLVDKIAKTAGLTNDISLMDGKMGIIILLFQGSRYFSSKDFEKVAEFLIDDIVEEKAKLSQMANSRTSEIFWALNYLSDSGFIELEDGFFSEIDELLFSKIYDLSKISAMNYPALGTYILSRYRTSKDTGYWVKQIQTYLRNMMKVILSNKVHYRKNTNLLAPFWYVMLTCKEKMIRVKFKRRDFRGVCSFFDEIYGIKPAIEKQECWYQFYNLYNEFEFKYNPTDISTISDVNTLFLNKLLYADLIMPPDNQILEVINSIVNDSKRMDDLSSLLSYQNIGISNYVTGFAWALLYYSHLHDENLTERRTA